MALAASATTKGIQDMSIVRELEGQLVTYKNATTALHTECERLQARVEFLQAERNEYMLRAVKAEDSLSAKACQFSGGCAFKGSK